MGFHWPGFIWGEFINSFIGKLSEKDNSFKRVSGSSLPVIRDGGVDVSVTDRSRLGRCCLSWMSCHIEEG